MESVEEEKSGNPETPFHYTSGEDHDPDADVGFGT
jgi:hypothetical protein